MHWWLRRCKALLASGSRVEQAGGQHQGSPSSSRNAAGVLLCAGLGRLLAAAMAATFENDPGLTWPELPTPLGMTSNQ